MSANAPPPPDPADWHAQYLRLIAFPTHPDIAAGQNWWRELARDEPESSNRKRHERTDRGTFEGTSLDVTLDLLRIQWTAMPKFDLEVVRQGFPTLGPLAEREQWFRS